MFINEDLMRIRHEEFLAEAERSRLLSLVKLRPASVFPTNARLLAWMGGAMRRWGSRLENRFTAEVMVNQPQSIDSSLNV